MKLRHLNEKDVPFMLEWMHDEDVTADMFTDFRHKTSEDCRKFINSSLTDQNNLHFAIVSETDEYMGTVSLKHIDRIKRRGEFAIAIRRKAMGHGYSFFGMAEMIKKGFTELGLDLVYWCVSKRNVRAQKFYDKHGFSEMVPTDESLSDFYRGAGDLKWYYAENKKAALEGAFAQTSLASSICIRSGAKGKSGSLFFVEGTRDVPFKIERVYFITQVQEGCKRGFHAHKKLKQLLFCPYGKIALTLDDGVSRSEILLENPSQGILIERPIWREMTWIEPNSVLCVLASDYYDEADYIRDYEAFLSFQKENGYR